MMDILIRREDRQTQRYGDHVKMGTVIRVEGPQFGAIRSWKKQGNRVS